MRTAAIILLVLLCVTLLCSCGGGSDGGYYLGPEAFGTTKTLSVGQWAVLELPANPSTGSSWHREWAPEALLALLDEYYKADTPLVSGSGGKQYFIFEATAPGTVVITVQYGQWWEGGAIQEPQTITLNITQ